MGAAIFSRERERERDFPAKRRNLEVGATGGVRRMRGKIVLDTVSKSIAGYTLRKIGIKMGRLVRKVSTSVQITKGC